MRLGSGRVRSRCIMQFSLAAGSDRAVGTAGLGWGSAPGGGARTGAPTVRGLGHNEGEPRLPGVRGADPVGKEGPGIFPRVD